MTRFLNTGFDIRNTDRLKSFGGNINGVLIEKYSEILKERLKVHHTNFVILKNLKVPSEKVHGNIQRILKERLKVHHTNFVILKNLKGG